MKHRVLAASAALTLGLAACGGSDEKSSSGSGSASASDGKLDVSMTDYKFGPSNATASAGKLEVTARNDGKVEHEFVLLKTNAAPDGIPLKDGEASEDDTVGEIAETEPGKSATHTFDLKPGRYVFICNVDHHYTKGMRGALVVK